MCHFSWNPVYNTGENTGKNIKKQYIEVFVFFNMFKKSKKIQIWTKYKKAYFLTKQEKYHFCLDIKYYDRGKLWII